MSIVPEEKALYGLKQALCHDINLSPRKSTLSAVKRWSYGISKESIIEESSVSAHFLGDKLAAVNNNYTSTSISSTEAEYIAISLLVLTMIGKLCRNQWSNAEQACKGPPVLLITNRASQSMGPFWKINCYLNEEKSQRSPIFKIAVDILKQTNFFRAFTASSTIPAIYIQQFWDTIRFDSKAGSFKCQLDEQWFNLNQDTLRDALQITPVDKNRAFSSPPTHRYTPIC
ncbi:hypothetical protein Tco_0478969 [Tanacetum coccineum]